MTPALQKMVEAMAAEVGRQVSALGGRPVGLDLPLVYSHQPIDLEKVARAGLEAIMPPDVDFDVYERGSVASLARGAVRDFLDEILKETP